MAEVVNQALLLLQVEADPVMETRDLAFLDFTCKIQACDPAVPASPQAPDPLVLALRRVPSLATCPSGHWGILVALSQGSSQGGTQGQDCKQEATDVARPP